MNGLRLNRLQLAGHPLRRAWWATTGRALWYLLLVPAALALLGERAWHGRRALPAESSLSAESSLPA
jgi:hypothetical protein